MLSLLAHPPAGGSPPHSTSDRLMFGAHLFCGTNLLVASAGTSEPGRDLRADGRAYVGWCGERWDFKLPLTLPLPVVGLSPSIAATNTSCWYRLHAFEPLQRVSWAALLLCRHKQRRDGRALGAIVHRSAAAPCLTAEPEERTAAPARRCFLCLSTIQTPVALACCYLCLPVCCVGTGRHCGTLLLCRSACCMCLFGMALRGGKQRDGRALVRVRGLTPASTRGVACNGCAWQCGSVCWCRTERGRAGGRCLAPCCVPPCRQPRRRRHGTGLGGRDSRRATTNASSALYARPATVLLLPFIFSTSVVPLAWRACLPQPRACSCLLSRTWRELVCWRGCGTFPGRFILAYSPPSVRFDSHLEAFYSLLCLG